jgi:hypothetical protein
MFRASTTCRSTHSLWISTMAFLIAFTHCVNDGDSASNSTIYRYTPNTSSVRTSLLGPIVLVRALNAICRAMSLSILGSLMTII